MNPCRHGPAGSWRSGRPGQEKLQFPVDFRRGGHGRAARRGQQPLDPRDRLVELAVAAAAVLARCRGAWRRTKAGHVVRAAPGRSRPARRGPACPARADPAAAARPARRPVVGRQACVAAVGRASPPLSREKEYCRRPAGSGGTAARYFGVRPRPRRPSAGPSRSAARGFAAAAGDRRGLRVHRRLAAHRHFRPARSVLAGSVDPSTCGFARPHRPVTDRNAGRSTRSTGPWPSPAAARPEERIR